MGAKSLVITGPSGAGKSTIINKLLENSLFKLSVSYTTRQPREGEVNGKDYVFVSKDEFRRKIDEGFFMEYAQFGENLYGTPLIHLNEESIVIFDIELRGVKFFKKNSPDSYFCLVKISKEEMEKRLYNRMIRDGVFDSDEFQRRMESFSTFEGIEKTFDFNRTIDNSRDLKDTKQQIDDLINAIIKYYG